MNACTIIAKNYLAHARVLANSVAEHHPDSRFSVLIVDDLKGYIDPSSEPFEVLTSADLLINDFDEMASRYDILELSTAVKPWLLERLLERDDHVVYLDPDIRLYASIEDVAEACRRHELVLTPHNLTPMPRDGMKPTESDILIAGAYNLGFIGLGRSAASDRLLGWWSERLRTDCIVDPANGFFVDQRWIDLVPSMVDSLLVIRDPGVNVAYWNLHAREVSNSNGARSVNGVPLRFFHFSGYDPRRPTELSKHQNRIVLDEHPVLRDLCDAYAAELRDAGYDEVISWPYTYAATPGGVNLERPLRRQWADGVLAGAITHPAFEPDGERELMGWLGGAAPEGGEQGINRLMWAWYLVRPDLQRAFPDLDGRDAPGLIEWFQTRGLELGIPAGLVPEPPTAVAPTRASTSDLSGVNVAGYFTSEVGVGEIARQVIGALDARRVPTYPVGLIATASRQGHNFETGRAADAPYELNLVCVNADQLPRFAADVGEDFFRGRYTIGIWWWEIAQFPEVWRSSFDHVDELWVGSEFIAETLRPIAPVPVVHMRMPVGLPDGIQPDRPKLELPDGFIFLYMFDFNSVLERKNPIGLIEAFKLAFPKAGPGVSLVLKCINGERHPAQAERLKRAAAGRPDIVLLDRYVTHEEKNQLLVSCDCYVSLHRSEGLGITLLEAMLLERPVIATAYSGSSEYMLAAHSYPVDAALVAVGRGNEPYAPEAVWGDPDLDQAARYMRHVVDDPGEAGQRGLRAAQWVRAKHSPAATGEAMVERLEHLVATRAGRAEQPERTSLEHVHELARRGPLRSTHPRWHPRRLLRALLLRLARPQIAYQEEVDAALADGLEHVAGLARDEASAHFRRVEAELHGLEAELHGRVDELRERTRFLTKANSDVSAHLAALGDHVGGLQQFADDMTGQPDFERSRAIYPTLGDLARRYESVSGTASPSAGEPDLTRYELRVFSQNGEDGVIAEILRRIGVGEHPFFVEFGIETGAEGNCVYLADVLGWEGLFIEADDEFYDRLAAKYRWAQNVRTLKAFVTPDNVERLFTDVGVPAEPTVLSIDIDGPDLWVWRTIDSFRPRVVVIEVNSSLDPTQRMVQPPDHQWDRTEYQGASLGALAAVGREKNYRLVHVDLAGVNAFFVRDDLPGAWPANPRARGVNLYLAAEGHPADEHGRSYQELPE